MSPTGAASRLRALRTLEFEVGIRAALAAVIPLVVLLMLGHVELAPYAAFGGMTAIFGRGEHYRARARTVGTAAVALVASVAAGTLLAAADAPLWAEALALVAVLIVGTLVVAVARLGPPTTLFFVFALLVCAEVPTPTDQVAVRIAITALSAAFAFGLSVSGWMLRRFGGERVRAVLKELPKHPPARFDALGDRAVWLNIAQVVLAAVGAGAVALAFGVGHPYWAVVGAIAVVPPPGAAHSLTRARHRVFGTIGGVLVTALILWPDPPVWVLIIVIGIAQFGAEVLVGRHYGAAMLFVTPLALVVSWIASPSDPGGLLVDRVIETVIGCAVGVVLVLAGRFVESRWGRLAPADGR
ncbi:FUSC family protein [Agromyces neolithicus]|uniref:FUSC family protein n=1 Tax=Agromyces neolithicus TaxID=269420 RepID=A0ABN2M6K7_9MICO